MGIQVKFDNVALPRDEEVNRACNNNEIVEQEEKTSPTISGVAPHGAKFRIYPLDFYATTGDDVLCCGIFGPAKKKDIQDWVDRFNSIGFESHDRVDTEDN